MRFLGALILIPAAVPAVAGPPYTTDDPEPTPIGHWEDRILVDGVQSPGETIGQSGFDINYGAAKDFQLTLLAPIDFDHSARDTVGAGAVQLAAKYLVVHQSDWTPDVSLFPAVLLPTEARAFGPAHLGFFLPVWMQKDFGAWSTFGGGGYDINPGRGNRNFTLAGWALTRQVTKRLNVGAEVYHETAEVPGGKALTAAAGGVIYQLTDHFALMASGGPAVQKSPQGGQGVFYAALQYTY